MTCTFFGHKDTPLGIEPILNDVLTELIENNKADTFYVGNHGQFDSMVKTCLEKLKIIYPQIEFYVVLAYFPRNNETKDYSNTIFPDGLETVPPKFAISKRNQWLVEKSDTVITYVKHTFGGAHKFKELAKRKNKIIVELSEI